MLNSYSSSLCIHISVVLHEIIVKFMPLQSYTTRCPVITTVDYIVHNINCDSRAVIKGEKYVLNFCM